jgi:hypothetical protein
MTTQPDRPPYDRTGTVPGTAYPLRGPEPRAATGPVSRRRTVTYPLVSTMPPLGALATAPGSARAHVRSTLAEWQLMRMLPNYWPANW